MCAKWSEAKIQLDWRAGGLSPAASVDVVTIINAGGVSVCEYTSHKCLEFIRHPLIEIQGDPKNHYICKLSVYYHHKISLLNMENSSIVLWNLICKMKYLTFLLNCHEWI